MAELLESASEAITPASVVAELKEPMLRHGVKARIINEILNYVKSRTTVVGIDSTVAKLAGKLNFVRKRATKD